jgi:hypothetical protein
MFDRKKYSLYLAARNNALELAESKANHFSSYSELAYWISTQAQVGILDTHGVSYLRFAAMVWHYRLDSCNIK